MQYRRIVVYLQYRRYYDRFEQVRAFSVCRSREERKRGQAMVEFMVVAGMVMASLAILWVFLDTFKDYGTRVLNLVASEYP